MSDRSKDWLRQAEADLRHARNAREDGDHEWACFAAQQAAEKGLKGLVQHLGGEPWGHSVTVLVGGLALPPPGLAHLLVRVMGLRAADALQ